MLECLSFRSLTSSSASASASAPVPTLPTPNQGNSNSTERTPVISTQSSPALNVSGEFNLAVQADSYNEIRSSLQVFDPSTIDSHQHQVELVDGYDEESSHRQLLAQVLHPDRQCVQEALEQATPNTLNRLVSTYFDHSETTSELCLILHRSVHLARIMYAPLLEFLRDLPSDSNHLTQSLCDHAFDLFLKFDSQDNPFPSPDSDNFSNVRNCFSDLRQELDRRLRKSRSKLRLLRRATNGSALCFIATTVGVIVSVVVVTTHAFAAIAAAPLCFANIPLSKNTKKKELARLAKLEAAAKGTYALNKDLDTIDRLVSRLHTAVEGDKLLIRLGLERGKDRHAIQEVLKQLRRNHQNFLHHLDDLEVHIYLCFNFVNKTRSKLLHEICLHQTV
ncbi:UPF0496 protein [Senna tora]|uniref:UPF0496 protein n=1 Tax=Senna tora TaxID=362788 RepID=A0A834WH94_9FABA|nr:UPF0496 protein [Senna tora]